MPEADQKIRSFIAVDVSTEFREAATRLQNSLRQGLPNEAVRWTAIQQIHLTLKFLGHVPSANLAPLEAALERSCQGMKAFQLQAATVGAFPNLKNARVIWIGLAGDLEPLLALQKTIDLNTAPFAAHEEDREFRPHVTLGRLRENADCYRRALGELLGKAALTPVQPWRVDRVKLMQSKLARTGAEYSVLKEVTW